MDLVRERCRWCDGERRNSLILVFFEATKTGSLWPRGMATVSFSLGTTIAALVWCPLNAHKLISFPCHALPRHVLARCHLAQDFLSLRLPSVRLGVEVPFSQIGFYVFDQYPSA